jgi:hypothetical protein
VSDLVGGGLKLFADRVEDLVGCAGFQLAMEFTDKDMLGAAGQITTVRVDHLRGGRGGQ